MKKIKIVIFGSSGMGKLVNYSLNEEQYEIVAYMDNCKEIQGKMYCNAIIINPEEINNFFFDFVIISLPEYEKAMKLQLYELGVPEEKIITFLPNQHGVIWHEPRFAMMRNCADQIIERSIGGNVAELGVYQGEFASQLNRIFPDRKLYLFDTFQGFSNNDNHDNDENIKGREGFKDTNIEEVMRRMRYPENVIVKKGWFPDTAIDVDDEFCFVSLDTDLYKPILNGLEFFYPRLVNGGYIFIHDFGSYNWTGVKKAVYEFCDKNQISFVPIMDKCLSVVITK